jgi:hypothetical protein
MPLLAQSDSRSASFRKKLHAQRGQCLAYIHLYTRLHRRPPAEADIRQYFRVTPPSMLKRAGFIRRRGGVPRSTEVLVDPKLLPELL